MSELVTEGLLEQVEEGRGFFETVVGAQPGAGSGFTLPPDSRYITVPLFVSCRLVASADAANRFVAVDYVDGNGNTYARNGGGFVSIANATADFYWLHDRTQGEHATGSPYLLPLSHDYIRPGYSLKITVDGIQAADQLSRIIFGVDRLPTGPRGYVLGATSAGHVRRAGGFAPRSQRRP